MNVASVALHEVHVLKQDSWIINKFLEKNGKILYSFTTFSGDVGSALGQTQCLKAGLGNVPSALPEDGVYPNDQGKYAVTSVVWYIMVHLRYSEI